MKKILLRCMVTLIILFILRFLYISIVNVPFFQQVFVSTSLGLVMGQGLVQVAFYKFNRGK